MFGSEFLIETAFYQRYSSGLMRVSDYDRHRRPKTGDPTKSTAPNLTHGCAKLFCPLQYSLDPIDVLGVHVLINDQSVGGTCERMLDALLHHVEDHPELPKNSPLKTPAGFLHIPSDSQTGPYERCMAASKLQPEQSRDQTDQQCFDNYRDAKQRLDQVKTPETTDILQRHEKTALVVSAALRGYLDNILDNRPSYPGTVHKLHFLLLGFGDFTTQQEWTVDNNPSGEFVTSSCVIEQTITNAFQDYIAFPGSSFSNPTCVELPEVAAYEKQAKAADADNATQYTTLSTTVRLQVTPLEFVDLTITGIQLPVVAGIFDASNPQAVDKILTSIAPDAVLGLGVGKDQYSVETEAAITDKTRFSMALHQALIDGSNSIQKSRRHKEE